MIDVFDHTELPQIKRKRLMMIIFYTLAAAFVVIADVLLIVFLKPVSYAGGLAANIVLTALFACGSLFFFDLPFRRVSKYFKFLSAIEKGLKTKNSGVFLYLSEETTEENGVSFVEIVLEEQFSGHDGMHRLLLEHSHARPDFHLGDRVSYVSQANILLSYEVTDRIPDELLTDEERARSAELTEKAKAAAAVQPSSMADVLEAAVKEQAEQEAATKKTKSPNDESLNS